MSVERDVRIAPAGAGLVRFQDRAAICRFMLLAQLCMDRKLVPERLEEAYEHACALLEAMSQ